MVCVEVLFPDLFSNRSSHVLDRSWMGADLQNSHVGTPVWSSKKYWEQNLADDPEPLTMLTISPKIHMTLLQKIIRWEHFWGILYGCGSLVLQEHPIVRFMWGSTWSNMVHDFSDTGPASSSTSLNVCWTGTGKPIVERKVVLQWSRRTLW